MKVLIVVEQTESGFSAYSPDVPGCVATGESHADVEAAMREVIAFDLDGLREGGLPLPVPSAYATSVDVAA